MEILDGNLKTHFFAILRVKGLDKLDFYIVDILTDLVCRCVVVPDNSAGRNI